MARRCLVLEQRWRLDWGGGSIKVRVLERTYVTVAGDGYTLDIKAKARAGGREWLPEMGYRSGLTALQIPEGNGDTVTLSLQMSCEEIDCGYFVQAFVR